MIFFILFTTIYFLMFNVYRVCFSVIVGKSDVESTRIEHKKIQQTSIWSPGSHVMKLIILTLSILYTRTKKKSHAFSKKLKDVLNRITHTFRKHLRQLPMNTPVRKSNNCYIKTSPWISLNIKRSFQSVPKTFFNILF